MHRFALLLLLLTALGFLALPGADASSTSYIARLGTTHGASRLVTGPPNTVYVNAKSLSPGAWTVRLYIGTCSLLSTRIVTLPNLIVGSRRAAARTYAISTSQARLGKSGAILLSRGNTRICGRFGPEVARSPLPSPSTSPRPSPSPSPSPSVSPSTSPTSSPTTSTAPTSTASAAPTPPPGTIMVDRNGHGSATTAAFVAPRNWEIDYQYQCGSGEAAAFSITISVNGGPSSPVVSKATSTGQGSIPMTATGSVQLQITTACSWQVFAIAN